MSDRKPLASWVRVDPPLADVTDYRLEGHYPAEVTVWPDGAWQVCPSGGEIDGITWGRCIGRNRLTEAKLAAEDGCLALADGYAAAVGRRTIPEAVFDALVLWLDCSGEFSDLDSMLENACAAAGIGNTGGTE